MTSRRRASCIAMILCAGLLANSRSAAGDEKALVGSYRLVKRVTKDGSEFVPPGVVGFMTFTKTHRTVIMKWSVSGAEAASIAEITSYTLEHGAFCESVEYGVN